MKRFLKTAIAMLALTGAFFALTACNKVTDVSVATNPQLVFVQGNPIDLSLGTLSVTDKETTKEIAMDAKGVKVSGYNANQLGSQEITISYEGKSTKLTVEVVPRMKIEGAIVDYLVGESFDTSKGRIRFYKDDGTQSTVQLSNSAVTVKDFDSSTATSPLEITISYKTGSEEYTQPMDVNIYDVSTNDFKSPNKIAYKSHDDEINLKGGLITLYSANREVTRYVQMESVKVSGFDLSAAGVEHMSPNKPLEQKITLTYGAFDFEYKIYITYTEVSLVKDLAKDLMELDWSQGEFPEISNELGENALLAAETFMNLSEGDKMEITSEEQVYIALAATVYGHDTWAAEAEKYADAFTLEDGFDFADEASYDTVKAAYDALSANPDSPLFTTAATLLGISETFGETQLKEDGTKISEYLEDVYDPAGFAKDKALERMKYLTDLYAALPETCSVDTISANKTAIESALTLIKNGGFNTYNYRVDHDMMNSWRAEADFFDILYTYLYDNNKLEAELATLQDIGLPGISEELYRTVLSAYIETLYLMQNYSYETTWFMVYYNEVLELEKQHESDNGMYKLIYDKAQFGGFSETESVSFKDLHTALERNGYMRNLYPVYGNATTMGHWDKYMALMEMYRNAADKEAFYKTSEFQTAAKAMFDEFVNMLPSEQVAFLSSLAPLYAQYGVAILDIAQKEDGTYAAYNYYRMFLMKYSEEVLTPTLVGMFDNFVGAIERYAFAPHIQVENDEANSGVNPFLTKMKAVMDSYGNLADGGDEKTTFDTLFGTAYAKYSGLYAKLTATDQTPTDLGDYADEFEAVKDALYKAGMAASVMDVFQQYNSQLYAYNIVIGAYEQARAAVEAILSSGNEAIIYAYYYEAYDVYGDGLYCTVDMAYEDIRSYTANILLSLGRYDEYEEKAPKAFFAKSADQMLDFAVFYLNIKLGQEAEIETTPEEAKALMAEFRALTDDEKYVFLLLDLNRLYHNSLMYIFDTMSETEDWANALLMLMNMEYYYSRYYALDPDGYMDAEKKYKTTDEMQETVDNFYKHYNMFTEEEKALFNQWFGDMFNYYVEKYEAAGITFPTQENTEEQPAA